MSPSIYAWNLANEAVSGAGTNFDQIQASADGNILLSGALTLNLSFGSGINFSDSFWDSTETWDVIDATADGASLSGAATFDISSSASASGTFSAIQAGNEVELVWTPTDAVPEPSTYLLLLGGVALLLLASKRKREL